MKVPFLDLQPQYVGLRDEILSAITRVCDSQQFILGPEVEQFEAECAATIGVRHAIGVSSGTDALLVALMALGIGSGDEVIVPAFSFFATAGSVARLGARPVFVDVDPTTLMMEADAVSPLIGSRTRAIVPVHLFGLCADMAPLMALATRTGLAVVEDAAQGIGATYRGRSAGALGTIGCFSFFPTKNLGAFGEAGLVTTEDPALAARLRLLRNHGAERRYHHREVGGNFRLDALQAAVLRVKLPHVARWNEDRRANAAAYGGLFAEAGLDGAVSRPVEPEGRLHTFHQYVVRVPARDRVRAHLHTREVGSEIYYPVPLDRQECFAPWRPPAEGCPVAQSAAADVLALPIFPGLTREQQEWVVASLAEVVG